MKQHLCEVQPAQKWLTGSWLRVRYYLKFCCVKGGTQPHCVIAAFCEKIPAVGVFLRLVWDIIFCAMSEILISLCECQ